MSRVAWLAEDSREQHDRPDGGAPLPREDL